MVHVMTQSMESRKYMVFCLLWAAAWDLRSHSQSTLLPLLVLKIKDLLVIILEPLRLFIVLITSRPLKYTII